MSFFSAEQIKTSLKNLEAFHPFFGISFLVFKKGDLPVGKTTEFFSDGEERDFLNYYYKPEEGSSWFFRVFKAGADKRKQWLDNKYPSAGSQSTRTRGAFSQSLIHVKDTNLWGWETNYVQVLKDKLPKNKTISVFDLAVWLFREKDWPKGTSFETVTNHFLDYFHINDLEESELFDTVIPKNYDLNNSFSPKKLIGDK